MSGAVDVLPTAARLYYTGVGSRRYKRASVQSGPGEPLCFKSVAEEAIRRARAEERAAVAELIEAGKQLLPRNLCLNNPRWPDSTEIPLTTTLGELRAFAAALANVGSAS